MKNRHLSGLILVSGIVFMFLTIQCYTTFQHPPVETASADSTDGYRSETISFVDNCSSCHVQNDPLTDSHLQLYDAPQYDDNYSWQYYYVLPWWMDDDYYYQDQLTNTNQDNHLPAPLPRSFERRSIPASPATASPGISGGALAKPSSNNSSSSGSETTQAKPTKRHARRQAIKQPKSTSQQPTPTRKKRAQKQTVKKEKK